MMTDVQFLKHRLALQIKGYTVVPNAISPEMVAETRRRSEAIFEKSSSESFVGMDFVATPPIAQIPFQPSVVAALRGIVGRDYYTIPEFALITNSFGDWHRDIDTQQRDPYVYRRDYRQFECAIYLQDNHRDYGGAIDFRPFTHRNLLPCPLGHTTPLRVARRVTTRWFPHVSMWVKAGDMIIWDFRLAHRATPARIQPIPKSHTKYGVFWGATDSRVCAEKYLAHMKRRGVKEAAFNSMSRVSFPHSFAAPIVDLVERQNVRVATLAEMQN
jgi:ectoine hydroxylase-related dioxygenase (phytanoyl-CoA dioxygenase family)